MRYEEVTITHEGEEPAKALIISRGKDYLLLRDAEQFWGHGEKELIKKCITSDEGFWEALAKYCPPENYDTAVETYFIVEKQSDGTWITDTGITSTIESEFDPKTKEIHELELGEVFIHQHQQKTKIDVTSPWDEQQCFNLETYKIETLSKYEIVEPLTTLDKALG